MIKAAVTVAVLALGLAACGADNAANNTDSNVASGAALDVDAASNDAALNADAALNTGANAIEDASNASENAVNAVDNATNAAE